MFKRVCLSLVLLIGLVFSASHLTATVPGGLNSTLLGGTSCSATTWDSANHGSAVSLSNGNKTAAWASGTNPAVRTVAGLTTGKFYWETLPTAIGSATWIGFVNGTFNISGPDILNVANSWGYRNNGDILNNGAAGGTFSGYTTIATVMQALDIGAGKWWVGVNGTWQNSGNPTAGTGAVVSSGITGTLYAAAAANSAGTTITGNWGATTFNYSVPSGFNAGFCT